MHGGADQAVGGLLLHDLLLHGDAGGRHQLLGVGPGQPVLDHRGRPCGGQAGEQHAALHLGAGHRQPVLDARQASPTDSHRRPAPVAAALHRGAHGPQRVQHPAHRPAADRLVAVEDRPKVHPGQQAGQEADPRARVAHVQRPVGWPEVPAPDGQRTVAGHPGLGTQGLHDPEGAAHVLAVAEAPDGGSSVGQGGQHQDPVGDRLVAGDPEPSPEWTPGLYPLRRHGARGADDGR